MIPVEIIRKAVLLEKIRATINFENSSELTQKGKASGEELIRFLDSKLIDVPDSIVTDSESISFKELEKGIVFTRSEIEKIRKSEKPMNLSALDELERIVDLQSIEGDVNKLIREVVKIRVEAEMEKRIRGVASFVISNEHNLSEKKIIHLVDYAKKSGLELKDLHAIINMTAYEETLEKFDDYLKKMKEFVGKKKSAKKKKR